MVTMFCTLQEAAQRLRVSEEQVEALLRDGVLREFREGSCRLLKSTDVAILAALHSEPSDSEWQATDDGPGTWSESQDGRPAAFAVSGPRAATSYSEPDMKLPHRATAAPGRAVGKTARPRNRRQVRQEPMAARQARRSKPAPMGARVAGCQSRQMVRQINMQAQSLTFRQWLWNGLMQDHPMAIVILFGLVLLILSGLAAGASLLWSLIGTAVTMGQ